MMEKAERADRSTDNQQRLQEWRCGMKYGKALGILIIVLVASGCSQQAGTPASKDSRKKEADHAHGTGPNGGVVFDLGKYHAEFTVDHPMKECTVLVLNGDSKDARPLPVAAKELTLTTRVTKTQEGKAVAPMTIRLLPKDEKDGKASKFVGTDPGLGNVADFEGTVLGEIDGKPSQGTFKE